MKHIRTLEASGLISTSEAGLLHASGPRSLAARQRDRYVRSLRRRRDFRARSVIRRSRTLDFTASRGQRHSALVVVVASFRTRSRVAIPMTDPREPEGADGTRFRVCSLPPRCQASQLGIEIDPQSTLCLRYERAARVHAALATLQPTPWAFHRVSIGCGSRRPRYGLLEMGPPSSPRPPPPGSRAHTIESGRTLRGMLVTRQLARPVAIGPHPYPCQMTSIAAAADSHEPSGALPARQLPGSAPGRSACERAQGRTSTRGRAYPPGGTAHSS